MSSCTILNQNHARLQPRERRPPSWAELPHRHQLAILALVRLAEPIAQTSMHAYMFSMVQSFDTTMDEGEVAGKAGLLAASFEASQALTGVMWGYLADKPSVGRKPILLLGLTASLMSLIGFGFSKTFQHALLFRCLGGAFNGNVGVLRTMVSEIVIEKRYHAKAFLLMPITFNIGILIGPLIGGLLQDPLSQYPKVFGPNGLLGQIKAIAWVSEYPYMLPNVFTAIITFFAILLAVFGLHETHSVIKGDIQDEEKFWQAAVDFIRRWLSELFSRMSIFGSRSSLAYELISPQTLSENRAIEGRTDSDVQRRLPYRRILTFNVVLTLLTHFFLAIHIGSFNTLWSIYLSTPIENFPTTAILNGGLGLPPASIGVAISIIGLLGLLIQFGIFSNLTYRFGILTTFRVASLVFPVVYLVTPLLTLFTTESPDQSVGNIGLWIAMMTLLSLQVTGRTFALPLIQVLTNNSAPHSSVLGSLHGIGSSVSSAAFSMGPILWSWLFGKFLHNRASGLAWLLLAMESFAVQITSSFLFDDDSNGFMGESPDN